MVLRSRCPRCPLQIEGLAHRRYRRVIHTFSFPLRSEILVELTLRTWMIPRTILVGYRLYIRKRQTDREKRREEFNLTFNIASRRLQYIFPFFARIRTDKFQSFLQLFFTGYLAKIFFHLTTVTSITKA